MTIPRHTPARRKESVWDYPRPPQIDACSQRIRVVVNSITIADTTSARRVLETSHPPVYYIPPQDIRTDCLLLSDRRSFCEWKGEANYYSIVVAGKTIEEAGWFYPNPFSRFAEIKEHVAFYASKMEACYVNGELAQAQAGDFYGGWITSNIVGPFKGAPGTLGW